MIVHYLKTWRDPFDAVVRGAKCHEVRRNDRDFHAGDRLALLEWDNRTAKYTGRRIDVLVTHVTAPGTFGLPDDLIVMSVRTVSLLQRKKTWTGEAPWPEAA